MEKKIHQKLLCLLIILLSLVVFLSGAYLSTFQTVFAKEMTTEQETFSSELYQRLGVIPTEATGQKDDKERTILGETEGGGIVSCSADLETLKNKTFGDAPKPAISTFASGWDDGTIYRHDFTLNGNTITTTSPIIYISDNGADSIAYCADPSLNIPSESAGAGVHVTYIKDSANVQSFRIRNIMYWGYHPGQSGEYYVQTWAAIRVVAGISSYTDYYMTDPVVADLVNNKSYQDPPNWNADWKLIAEREEATWNPTTERQETGCFQTQCTNIKEHGEYTVNLPSGVHAICRRTTGETYGDYTGSFTIYDDDDFMLYADGSYKGEVSATVTPTTIKRHTSDAANPDACVIYKPDIPNTQRLFVSLATGQSSLSGSFKAVFKGATGDVKLIKTETRYGNALDGAVFGVYQQKDDKLITQGTTDQKGELLINDLVYGDYYFKEIEAPPYYVLNTQKLPFTIDGIRDTVTVSAKNDEKQVPFEFIKTDEMGQALEGVTFKLYTCDKNHTHQEMQGDTNTDCWQTLVSEVTSNQDGKVDFGNLYSGDYQLVETKTVAGYAKPYGQWRVIIDVEKEDPITIETKGSAPDFNHTEEGFTLMNTPNAELPHAGGNGSFKGMLIGVILVVIAGSGIGWMYYQIRKEESKDSVE